MVHPNVFRAVGYDPDQYSGFAFGIGVDRVSMIKNGISDIRLFQGNDLRFLFQF
jgi:phenylalanyl-tRNA synthetase alpha chain